MLENFGNRLHSARKMSGLSMDKLVEKMGGIITKQAISKYEKGKMKPSSLIITKLSNALGVRSDYFLRKSDIDISQLKFRKKSKLAIKKEEALRFKAKDLLERYADLEDILNSKNDFKNPLETSKIVDFNDIERQSLEIRKKWNLGLSPICNILGLLEEKGIKVLLISGFGNFDGLSGWISENPFIIINNDIDSVRKRFTAAHELAHIVIDFSQAPFDSKEKLCHMFAGAFLLPKEVLAQELIRKRQQITLWELLEIKKIYGISLQAIVYRAHYLRYISDYHYRRFQIFINKNKWRKSEPGAYEGQEEVIRFKQLLNYAVAEEIITLSKAAELANMSLFEFEKEVQAVI